MVINDLLNEVRVYRHNSVKVMRVEKALKTLFPEDTPKVLNEANGIYVVLDIMQYRLYEANGLSEFILTFDKDMDEYKSSKKYFVEYFEAIEAPEQSDDTTEPKEEKSA